MTSFPKKLDIEELKNFDEAGCVTIYIPLNDQGAEPNQNRIELKNMLRQAEAALNSQGFEIRQIKKTLRPAKDLLNDATFWIDLNNSLALFMHPKMFRYFLIPEQSIPHQMVTGKGFDVEPLLDLVDKNQSYYVLALGHKKVQLYEGDNYQLHPVHIKDLPSDMKQALHIDEYPSERELHHIAPASRGKGSSAYHGQYNVKQVDKDMLIRFFRLIDKRLRTFMASKNEPLILASVQYLQPMYRRVNTYPHVVRGSIKGNVTRETLDNMRIKALRALTSS